MSEGGTSVEKFQATAQPSDAGDADVRQGRALLQRRDYAGAIDCFRRAAQMAPDRIGLQLDLGRALRLAGNSKSALTPLQQATALEPHNADAHYELGRAFLISGRPEAGERSLLRAIALNPAHAPAFQALARCLWRLQRLTRIESIAERWLDLAPDTAEAFAMKGGAIIKSQVVARLDEAARLLAKALSVEPGNAAAQGLSRDLARVRLFLELDRAYRASAGATSLRPPDRPGASDGIAAELARRIREAQTSRQPFSHFYLERVFPAAFYEQMMASRPPMDLAVAGAVDANYRDRKGFDLAIFAERDAAKARFWQQLYAAMKSEPVLDAFIDALQGRALSDLLRTRGFRLEADARLLCDVQGYVLTPHKDHCARFGSIVFNLPDAPDHPEAGTSVYVRTDGLNQLDNGWHHDFARFRRVATATYLPNSAFGFLNFGDAYHGVEPLKQPIDRWNMQYTVRIV